MNLGENIRKFRKANRFTLKQLGGFIGLSEQAISQYERNVREPSVEHLYKISKVLNVDINDLAGTKTTFFQDALNDLEKRGLTLETISIKSDLTIRELEDIKNNKEGLPLETYIKLGKYFGLGQEKITELVIADSMFDAFYNDKNNSPERNKIKKFLGGEPWNLEDLLSGTAEEDKEFIAQNYYAGNLNFTDTSKKTVNEVNDEFRLYLNKVDSFEKFLRQCKYPMEKIKNPDIIYLFNLTINFLDDKIEKILKEQNSDDYGE